MALTTHSNMKSDVDDPALLEMVEGVADTWTELDNPLKLLVCLGNALGMSWGQPE